MKESSDIRDQQPSSSSSSTSIDNKNKNKTEEIRDPQNQRKVKNSHSILGVGLGEDIHPAGISSSRHTTKPAVPSTEKMPKKAGKKSWIPWVQSEDTDQFDDTVSLGDHGIVDNSLLLQEETFQAEEDKRNKPNISSISGLSGMRKSTKRDEANSLSFVDNDKGSEHDYQRLETPYVSHSPKHLEIQNNVPNSTREDKVMEECNFFYTGLQESGNNPSGRGMNRNSRTTNWALENDEHALPRHLQYFRAKHEALNAPLEELDDNINDYNERMNFLPPDGNGNLHSSFFENSLAHLGNSALSYYRQGRMEIRLPSDHTRLVVDHNLEPGILSVQNDHINKQRLRAENMQSIREQRLNDLEKGKVNGRLSYVLTVEEDIYQRVVREMADSGNAGGIYYLFHETHEKRVKISVAVCILLIIFVVLIVGTFWYPLH